MGTIKQSYHSAEMQILLHHIYEINKGLRNLVLHTMNSQEKEKAEKALRRRGIDYFIQDGDNGKITIFFGQQECVKIIKSFGNIPLSTFSVEQDFMLGVMLGYDRMQQCERYIKKDTLQQSILTA